MAIPDAVFPYSIGKYIAEKDHSAKCFNSGCAAATGGANKGLVCKPHGAQNLFGCDTHGTMVLRSIDGTDTPDIVKPGEDPGDRHRMGNVRITAPAHLALMAPSRDIAGTSDQLGVSARPHGHDDLTEPRYEATPRRARMRRRTIHCDPPSQQGHYGQPSSPSSSASRTSPTPTASCSGYLIPMNPR
jgi:hypothetical protein